MCRWRFFAAFSLPCVRQISPKHEFSLRFLNLATLIGWGSVCWFTTMPDGGSFGFTHTFNLRNTHGDFDALFSGMETRTKLTSQEAFAGILLASSACDGHISDEELSQMFTPIFPMKLFERINEKEFHKVMNKLMGVLKKDGPEKLAEGCAASLPDGLRRGAFANACDIVLADGVVDESEKELTSLLTRLLSLEANEAKTIAQVMVIKNKG